MAYQVLARKWRPRTFADLVGQEHVVKALKNALDKGRLHHAYLLTGTRGVGKTTIARILAKSLNCEQPHNGEPCGVCQSCRDIDSGRFVDLLEIDAASNTGIDNIREVLENAQYAPTSGKYKVYIIDEVHMLSKSAFNAMLKTLEEPPEHVKFILATTDPHKVPITVLSRCLQFVLRNMTAQQVADHLAHVLTAESVAFEAPALQLLGRAAMGSMRDALSLLDQAIAMGSGSVAEQDVRQMIGAVDKRYLYELLQALAAQNGEALMAKAQEMAERSVGFDNALGELAVLLQRLAVLKTVPVAVAADDPERETLLQLGSQFGDEQIQLYYQCAIRGRHDLNLAPDEYAGFVMALLRMLAFAPMAAKAQPMNGTIAGTELHNPVAQEADTAKKPSGPSEPPPVAQAVVQLEQTVVGAAADVPPWQEIPEPPPATPAPVSQAPAAAVVKAEVPSPVVTAQPEPVALPPVSETLPEADNPIAEHIQAATWQREESEWEDMPSEKEEEYAVEAYTSSGGLDEDEEDGGLVPPVMPPVIENAAAAAEEEIELPSFEPFPEWSAACWPDIVKRLGAQLGVAQMLVQFAAWVSFEEDSQRLTLSLNGHAGAAASKANFDKIRHALAAAYDLPDLTVVTCAWRDDAGWETPTMYRARLQEEGRLKARRILEADPKCRQLMQELDCHEWKEDSLMLVENLDG